MIFYGDASRTAPTRDLVGDLAAAVGRAFAPLADDPPVERHAALVAALIAAGELAQGLADAEMAARGTDGPSPAERCAMALAQALGAHVGRHWESGFERLPAAVPPRLGAALAALGAGVVPDAVEVRRTEGFSHYALYPESYWRAARKLGPGSGRRVIGIRSVGTTLGAVAAAALGAPVPLTVRPIGHPFARHLRPGTGLDARLRDARPTLRVIADEGPGLSGSSFAAVAEALGDRGVAPDAIAFLPSHAGDPGAMASPGHRARWAATRRETVSFDDLVGDAAAPAHRLSAWVADLTGPLSAPVEDVSGGGWRDGTTRGRTPPADAQNERRKFLFHGARGTALGKFAGLGAFGARKLARARALARAGFTPPPLGLRHGFLLEPWRADLASFDPVALDRDRFLRHLGRYLGFRARALPPEPDGGASVEALFAMLRTNAVEALGAAAGPAVERWRSRLPGLARGARRVATDTRLHPWEWRVAPGGGWLKTDAVDHCAGHDLVGCQDIAWDVAGGAVEFDLSGPETALLAAIVEREGDTAVDPERLSFGQAAYAAFQLGAWTMARDRAPAEAALLDPLIGRYADALRRTLEL